MKLSEDKKSLKINLVGELTPDQVETLISDLAELRANMNPAVAMERPTNPDKRISTQDEPSIMAKRLKDGRIRFWLRNQGLGWLIFNFTIQQAIALRQFMISNTPETDGGPNLFLNEGSDSGPAH